MRPIYGVLGAVLVFSLACAGLPPVETSEAPPEDLSAEAEPSAREHQPLPTSRAERSASGELAGRPDPQPASAEEDEEPAATPSRSTRTRAASPRSVPDRGAAVLQLSETSWQVRRDAVDRWMEDPHSFADVTPHDQGWQLRGMQGREGAQLGFQNGDVVQAVNGLPIGTLSQAMLAYAQLSGATDLNIRFLRDGRVREHRIQIR